MQALHSETKEQKPYILADALPEIAQARQDVRQDAWLRVEQARQAVRQGSPELRPLQIDALSTAEFVIHTAETFGEDSPEHKESFAGLMLDCRRLVAEWYRKKKPEYFEPSRHFFDAETGDFFSHGLSIRQMTENALTAIDDNAEEEARRVNERVEEATPLLVKKLGWFALESIGIRTISECTDTAIAEYQEDSTTGQHRGYNGYVPEIEKLMIRDITFDESTGDRLEEQIGLPGIYITHDIIKRALSRCDIDVTDMDKTQLHGSQLIVEDDLLEFVELLDTVASEEWCTNVFMGEEVPAGFEKDYDSIRTEAKARQEQLADQANMTALYIMDLARAGTDKRRAPQLVESFVKALLLDIAKKDSAVAEEIFDKRTADGLRQVSYLESVGRFEEALALQVSVEKAAPGGGYCGAGSCGLERVNLSGEEGEKLKKALGYEAGDTVLKDTERPCKECGKKTIIYAFNKNKVNKYCTSCPAFTSERKSGGKLG